jgi:SAM-dependent methyltransferase
MQIPIPHSGRVFREHPKLRRLLHNLGWLRALPGAAVVATKRIHCFTFEGRSPTVAPIFIATDFPHTTEALHDSPEKVFSYSDEALVLWGRLQAILDRTPPRKIMDLCCGAGTLGLLCAAVRPDAVVTCVDSQARAVDQVNVNRVLNDIPICRLSAERGDVLTWEFPSNQIRFDLIVSDPSFSLRPPNFVSGNWRDDGGKYGDNFSGRVLEKASGNLERNGILLMLAYSLVKKSGEGQKRYRIVQHYPHPDLTGKFEPVPKRCVWRFRHDKIASNDPEKGMPLRYIVMRLVDPTRPESIIFRSPKKQQEDFDRYTQWLEDLDKDYVGLRYLMGEFTKEGY